MLLRSSNPAKSGKAFTLVEVLLGIIILAVGLLGLASVFPLVVRQQREAQDTVVGVSAARAIACPFASADVRSPSRSHMPPWLA